jgi:hypothetical protein
MALNIDKIGISYVIILMVVLREGMGFEERRLF